MKFKLLLSSLSIGVTVFSASSHADFFTDRTSPKMFTFQDETLETNFNKLKLEANVHQGNGHMPWSDTYWPANKGGIAVRYQTNTSGFKYVPYTLEELRAMTPAQISLLSPAEKFDIYRGRYDYPLVKLLREKYDPKLASWQGICHGWTPAAANFAEPQQNVVVNKDGLTIPFGSSDVKAMISYYYAWEAAQFNFEKPGAEAKDLDADGRPDNQNWGFDKNGQYWAKDDKMEYFIYRGLGLRSSHGRFGVRKEAREDMNPAAIHLLLANLVGRYHRSFNVDVDRGQQVWNQPIYGYKSEVQKIKTNKVACVKLLGNKFGFGKSGICNEFYDQGVRKEIEINTSFQYVVEYEPSIYAHGDKQLVKDTTLMYTLQLDENDQIVGGYWQKLGSQNYIDFLWRASRVPFLGEFSAINDIYKSNTKVLTSYALNPGYTRNVRDVSASEEDAISSN